MNFFNGVMLVGSVLTATVSFGQSYSCPGISQGNSWQFNSRLTALVNQARRSGRYCGSQWYPSARPLTFNSSLYRAADGHADSMASFNYMSHTGRDGSSPTQRIRRAGYFNNGHSGWITGENVAAGQKSVEAVVNAWLNSPDHCRNIMNQEFQHTAFSCRYNQNTQYKFYWAQKFGALERSGNNPGSRPSPRPNPRPNPRPRPKAPRLSERIIKKTVGSSHRGVTNCGDKNIYKAKMTRSCNAEAQKLRSQYNVISYWIDSSFKIRVNRKNEPFKGRSCLGFAQTTCNIKLRF